jgi:hypothetical protein
VRKKSESESESEHDRSFLYPERLKVTLTRKELYDLVWAEPLSKLAKKYKISDNGLVLTVRTSDISPSGKSMALVLNTKQ